MTTTINQVQKNVMELVVEEEINKQLRRFPANLRRYINHVEVATYALNRLPALYASSVEGLQRQQLKAETKYSSEVKAAVRQALAAVQRDLLRSSTPLTQEDNPELQAAREALKELAEVLPYQETSWSNAVKFIKPLLANFSLNQQNQTQLAASGDWTDYRYHC